MTVDTATWSPSQHDRDVFGRVREAIAPRAEDDDHAGASVSLSADLGAALAAGTTDTLVGVSLVKPGTFNGYFEVNRENLDAWVARFAELAPDTFVPPLRLNHSWDIESVVGWFTALRVENRPDTAAGGAIVPMLVGDVDLVGTPAENAQIRAWIKSGKLRNRSSEFWPYHTNAGVEYPSVFAGAAFVDIPAAEGLGMIELRRATLSSTTDPEGNTVTDDVTDETTDETTDEVVEPVEVDDAPEIGDAPPAEDPAPVEDEPVVEAPADLRAALEGANLTADQLRTVEAEVERRAALRVEADGRVEKFRTKGVIPLAVAPQVEALLRHTDSTVRDGVAALLEIAKPPVPLKAKAGKTGNEPTNADGTPTPAELRGLDGDEFAEAWTSLTLEQRQSAEYRAAYHEAPLA